MRLVPAFAVFASLAGVFFVNVPASQAQNGNFPWCAVVNTGLDNMSETCIYRTVEECRPNVIAGNRGFCELNPRYSGPPVQQRRKPRVKAH